MDERSQRKSSPAEIRGKISVHNQELTKLRLEKAKLLRQKEELKQKDANAAAFVTGITIMAVGTTIRITERTVELLTRRLERTG